ncbi:MAG: HlyD family efflux transporter periplasmic adaptor subunit [Acidobacteria bacterium]|nr:HlyD family efflux transporter periplasmic adaptor subunit [Acidobacteriota bacterium]
MKRRVAWTAVVVLVVGLGAAIAVAVPRLPEKSSGLPTARVVRGPLKLNVHATGELRAGRTVAMITPPVGGMLRIVKMVPTGISVKAGEVVMEFDPADQLYAVEQARTELAEAEQEIVKMKADREVQIATDAVELLTARFDVRRAELDAQGNEFISPIDAQKNLLSFEEAKRRLVQLEEDVKSRSATSQASLQVVDEKRTKAQMARQRAQQVIDSLVLKAPVDGVVSVKENRDASGGMFFFGMVLPEYREGDSVWPGRPVLDVIESGRMELRAKIDESDRTNLVEGQIADVSVDALPGRAFKAKVGALSGLASRGGFFEPTASVSRLFDVTFQFESPDPQLKAGSSARVFIEGKEIDGALHVPRQAVFEKNGKNHVFLKAGDRFESREVKVVQRTESRIALDGVDEGVEIALIDPNAAAAPRPAASTSPLPAGGGK